MDTDSRLGAQHSQCWGQLPLADIAESAWRVTSADRRRMHHTGGPCPTRHAPYGYADPNAELVAHACRDCGCLDLMHELMSLAVVKIQVQRERHPSTPIANPGAYAERVARTELVEWHRTRRIAQGFPAKPSRSDGVAGRVVLALGGSCPGEHGWLVTLFRIMRSYPFSPDHVCGRWPVEGLCIERLNHFPDQPVGPETIRREISLVMAVARRVAGPQWVYDNLVMPLTSNSETCRLPEDWACDEELDLESLLSRWLRASYLRHRAAGLARHAALRLASLEVTGLEPPEPEPGLDLLLHELERSADPPTLPVPLHATVPEPAEQRSA